MTTNDAIGPEPEMKYIAAGGCTVPYIGDWPYPQNPYVPGIPNQSPTIPGTGTTTNLKGLFNDKGTPMNIYIIWAITADFPDAPWPLAVWSESEREDDEDGFEEDLAAAEELYGGRYVRVTKSTVDYDAVVSAFGEVDI